MPFQTVNGIQFYTFKSLQAHGLVHAIFTRHGGTSPNPWKSLNVGGTVGDDPIRVLENRRRSLEALGRSVESVYDVWQVHGARVVSTNQPKDPEQPHLKADAICTSEPGLTLYMRFADCVPVLLYDPCRKVIGIAHAGWPGTVRRTAAALVRQMIDSYDCKPENLVAGIGPSIGPDHYEIGLDVIEQVRNAFGANADKLLVRSAGDLPGSKVKFDLWTANQLILAEVGVKQIETSGICTACHVEDWFSHRAERGSTGRFGALIGL